MKFLTYKVLFSIAVFSILSGFGASCPFGMVGSPFLVENPCRMILNYKPFTPPHDPIEQNVICPMQSLKIYLDLTKEYRWQYRASFVNFGPVKAEQSLSKVTLGRCLTEAIKYVYCCRPCERDHSGNLPLCLGGLWRLPGQRLWEFPLSEICLAAATWVSTSFFFIAIEALYRLRVDFAVNEALFC